MADVVVVGGGIAGLVAALEATRAGASVELLEAADDFGGQVTTELLSGVPVDVGAESFATSGTELVRLLASLGLSIVSPSSAGAWLALPDRTVPLPRAGVIGIPAFPLSDEVRAAIGWPGALRAYLDRLLPQLTIGREKNLGALVRRRMGARVLNSLVTPVVSRVYSVRPEEADLDSLAPGLNGALTATGSLSSAVVSMRAASPPGSAAGGIVGGMSRVVEALVSTLTASGASLSKGERVLSVTPFDSGWRVRTGDRTVDARRVILATTGSAARSLLAGTVSMGPPGDWPNSRRSTVALLRVRGGGLSAAPRGTGILVADGVRGISAKSLTHVTAKWEHVRAQFAGDEVLRLAYDEYAGTDAELEQTALGDATALLGTATGALSVVGFARHDWQLDPSLALEGQSRRVAALTVALDAVPGLSATGAWLSGTGLARVVTHASRAGLDAARG